MSTWTLLSYVAGWTIRIVMLFIVPRKRDVASASAWLLLILLEPRIGLFLYLLVGRHPLSRRLIRRHAEVMARLTEKGRPLAEQTAAFHPDLKGPLVQTVRLAERLSEMPTTGGNSVELLAESREFIDRLVADIDAAQQHVHLVSYIYADDETGRRVTDALIRAVERGVVCRVLVDSVGSRRLMRRRAEGMRAAGIDVREVLRVGSLRRYAARIDLRYHRKLVVIDGRIGYSGSQNIVDPDYGTKDLVWHDLMVRLKGPIVLELLAVFIGDWYFTTDEFLALCDLAPDPVGTGAVAAHILPSGPDYPTQNYQRLVVGAIHDAQERVTMTTPYFVPDAPFLQAMETAVLQGVEVRLIVPRRSNHPVVDAASRAYYQDLLDAGVKLYLNDEGLLHSKTMSIDGEMAFIGSSNFDIRSFTLDFEINLLFYDSTVAAQLDEQQRRYIAQSTLLTAEEWRHTSSRAARVVRTAAKLFSPLL